MRYELIAREPKTYVLIFETGDEIASGLKKVATEAKLSSSSFKAIGALSRVKLGWFGHLLEAYVRPTCELVLTESPAHLQKQFDPESGIALIKLPP